MGQFLILFREPDGRMGTHTAEEIQMHRKHWADWMANLTAQNILLGGKPLTLQGNVIRNGIIINGPYTKQDAEIVGGYLLLQCESLESATQIMTTCPIYEFDGFAEVRQCM